eukprot:4172392-Pleurochrysis_carterae.AAC.1
MADLRDVSPHNRAVSCASSRNLSANDLSGAGAARTTPPPKRARSSLARSPSHTESPRSNAKSYTCLCSSGEKAARSVPRDKCESGAGTASTTSFSLAESASASSGATTVVLPAPMIN